MPGNYTRLYYESNFYTFDYTCYGTGTQKNAEIIKLEKRYNAKF